MGMEIALIPAAMFIMGIGMMIYMKKKRDSLAPGYAQQEMKRFVKEMVPQLSEEEFHVIDCPWNAEHHFVIAYTDESIFFIPALPNPMTMKIMKYSGERGAGLAVWSAILFLAVIRRTVWKWCRPVPFPEWRLMKVQEGFILLSETK